MGKHFVSPTLVCYITVAPTTLATFPIYSVLFTASSLAAKIGVAAVVSTASIVLMIMLWCCSILHLHFLHQCLQHCLHLLQVRGQLLLSALHRVCHTINWFWNYCWVICQDLLLIQEFLLYCNHIVHHVRLVHSGVFNSEVR